MKNKENLRQLRKNKKDLKKANYDWTVKIIILTFIISLFFSWFSEKILANANALVGVLIVVFFIIMGIMFDMIGVAATAADEKPFHSMNSRRVRGAKKAVQLIKNASKVSSFCCDVIGDVCGIVSGSAGVIISGKLSLIFSVDYFIAALIVTALVASLTIGGKSLGKSMAINKSNFIIYRVSQILSIFDKKC